MYNNGIKKNIIYISMLGRIYFIIENLKKKQAFQEFAISMAS